jgi:prevent-host-death family protein
MIVNVHEAKTKLSALLERAHRGEEIIVAKAGRPYARLVPLEPPRERTPGRYSEEIPDSFFEPLPGEHRDAFDRVMAAQALLESVPVVSANTAMADLGAQRVWE